ncbi:M48 family metallopeptidase [Ideonella dechloratans]|uniref:M48 family metallopeptidase n=1 Tax=Ideonella dechloratans TaxID=36863 RepID=A0A643FBN9_IDEDE|nr:M48 family metallopeptidase [Ideonella dechloratans]KAB0578952.1 M48 family metallopeptidase [Ideonella dechloratans]UFU09117.1 M48 family metallopeptidase [Ideonella dechloratans]
MQAIHVSLALCAALLLSLGVKLWLASRQMRHVHAHRNQVPAPFDATIPLDAHQRAADYTIARTRFGMLSESFATAVLLGWTLLGGLEALNSALRDTVLPWGGALVYQLALVGAFGLISAVLELPFEWYRTFRIEQRFGFNRMSLGLFLGDQLKGLLVGTLVGLPLLAAVLWVMQATGAFWWVWAWALWTGFMLLMQVLYPTVIAPLFNRFTPLADAELANRIQTLMQRCGFQAKGLFVMDGSRRSAHGNAYFAGMGRAKRVVFFDTLLARLQPPEVEAVLAHELGHFSHHHVRRRMALVIGLSALGLALLAWLAGQTSFYQGLGVQPNLMAPNNALALLLFMLATPPFLYFVGPLMAQLSRRDEFQADAYACRQASSQQLAAALLKLYEDNASTLTPDPLYAQFYYSHPPASERLAALARA